MKSSIFIVLRIAIALVILVVICKALGVTMNDIINLYQPMINAIKDILHSASL